MLSDSWVSAYLTTNVMQNFLVDKYADMKKTKDPRLVEEVSVNNNRNYQSYMAGTSTLTHLPLYLRSTRYPPA